MNTAIARRMPRCTWGAGRLMVYSAQATRDRKTLQRSLDRATRRTRMAELTAALHHRLLREGHSVFGAICTCAEMLRVAELSG